MLWRRGDIYMFFVPDSVVIVIADPGGASGVCNSFVVPTCARTCVLSTIVAWDMTNGKRNYISVIYFFAP